LTLLLIVPVSVSEARRKARLLPGLESVRDRMEEADRSFFERVEAGYKQLAAEEPNRVRTIDATAAPEEVSRAIWRAVQPLTRNLVRSPHPAVDKMPASPTLSVPRKKLSL
jgi:dTMP kinase